MISSSLSVQLYGLMQYGAYTYYSVLMSSLHSSQGRFNDSYQNSNSQSSIDAGIKYDNSVELQPKEVDKFRDQLFPLEKNKDSSFEMLSESIKDVQSDLPRREISPNVEKVMSAFVKKQNQESNIHDVVVQNDKSNGSFSKVYKQLMPQYIQQIKLLQDRQELEKFIQILISRKEELEKKDKVVVHHVATSYVSADKYEKIHQKYEKYKGLYAQQLQNSKKLRGQLRNIYNKVSKIDQVSKIEQV